MPVWEWLFDDAISTSVSFSSEEYASQTDVGDFDILEYLQNSNLPECNFPVFPKVTLIGTLVKTDIGAFVQYAGYPQDEIPGNLVSQIRIIGQKGRYIGCSEGPNVSQNPINFFAYGTSLKITSITAIPDNQVIVSLGVINIPAGSLFSQLNNPFVNPFYPYNSATSTEGGVPLIGSCYLNNGIIQMAGLKAHYIPGNKYTNPSNSVEFDFSII
jgi:hypothetical protein